MSSNDATEGAGPEIPREWWAYRRREDGRWEDPDDGVDGSPTPVEFMPARPEPDPRINEWWEAVLVGVHPSWKARAESAEARAARAERATEAPGWIAVAERMPPPWETVVLALGPARRDLPRVMTGYVSSYEHWATWRSLGGRLIGRVGDGIVTHWMPMPAPPDSAAGLPGEGGVGDRGADAAGGGGGGK